MICHRTATKKVVAVPKFGHRFGHWRVSQKIGTADTASESDWLIVNLGTVKDSTVTAWKRYIQALKHLVHANLWNGIFNAQMYDWHFKHKSVIPRSLLFYTPTSRRILASGYLWADMFEATMEWSFFEKSRTTRYPNWYIESTCVPHIGKTCKGQLPRLDWVGCDDISVYKWTCLCWPHENSCLFTKVMFLPIRLRL